MLLWRYKPFPLRKIFSQTICLRTNILLEWLALGPSTLGHGKPTVCSFACCWRLRLPAEHETFFFYWFTLFGLPEQEKQIEEMQAWEGLWSKEFYTFPLNKFSIFPLLFSKVLFKFRYSFIFCSIHVHSCVSRSVKCGATSMGNSFQVTILDS